MIKIDGNIILLQKILVHLHLQSPGYKMQNSKVNLIWAHAEDHFIFNLVMH